MACMPLPLLVAIFSRLPKESWPINTPLHSPIWASQIQRNQAIFIERAEPGEEILIRSLMASAQQLVGLAILAVVVLPTVAMATQHVVGDNAGWTVNQKYDDWAKDKTFYVGDTLGNEWSYMSIDISWFGTIDFFLLFLLIEAPPIEGKSMLNLVFFYCSSTFLC